MTQWLYVLTKGYQKEDEMMVLAERNIGMDNFTSICGRTNMDLKLRARYDYRMSVGHDEASRPASAIDEGVAQGKEESAKKTAAKLLKSGMTIEDVADFVEYPLGQVKGWLGIL